MQKTRTALWWLFAPLFFFDCFRLYSLLYLGEYSRKQSNFFDQIREQTRIRPFFNKKEKIFSSYGGLCYLARAPPLEIEIWTNRFQIFGGNA